MVYALAQPGLELVTTSLLNVAVADRVNCAGWPVALAGGVGCCKRLRSRSILCPPHHSRAWAQPDVTHTEAEARGCAQPQGGRRACVLRTSLCD